MLKKSPDKAVSYIVMYIHFPASRGCTKKWVQEGVDEYLLKNKCKVALDTYSVTDKNFQEHGLYRLAKKEVMQKYTGCVRNTLLQNHKVKLDFCAKVSKDRTLPSHEKGTT